MKKVNWGVLSTAGIAQKQLLPAFMRAENAVVTAIATGSDVEKAQEIANKFEIEHVYDSYEKLLDDPTIDAVYIPLPNHLHKQWVIKAAKKGKHILCEKPAAIAREEVLEMKAACEENNVLFMEAFMYYFHPQHARVKEIIDRGEIGEVTFMQAGFSFYMPEERRGNNIRMSQEKGGGSIYDIGSYAIHTIRNILRAEPESVHVHAVMDPDYGIDTDAVGYLNFPNGIRASFDSSFNLAMRHEYKVHGTKGSITVPRAFRPDNYGGEGLIQIEKGDVTTTEIVRGDQYCLQVEHLSQAILDGEKTVHHTFENTLDNMAVIDACYASIASGKSEKIKG
ncbi:Gfo/Idh/MocA family protein [Sporosarcina pasteurii]|uniref:Glucose--fructose oxidoreductase n=1 Tax=Sporosarcina pasteurii TaxID=1474 RepID=A0A380BEM4_SPOPA|nr:Gfo/Idh/MocA family oxidoreductase [Sporosarcina pasteurii]MDS9472492.1 Gfo/Idh/MocA family oxidoreductase [Sporosarcina pasteurii]QBQ06047.1 Gfo/Idh/MocA family oxidoreductase [Sporosarcina pasteurii]SUI99628.1 Glucose--fructose oxidoreductase precursor [Sporosarcina pasteurii]